MTTTGFSVAGTVNPHDATTYRRQRGGCLRRTIQIQAGDHLITAADPLPDDLRQAIEAINASPCMRTSLTEVRKQYGDMRAGLLAAARQYVSEVAAGSYPDQAHSYA